MRSVQAFIWEHANALLFFGGFLVFEAGLSLHFGRPLAAIVGGAVIMLTAAWPWLRLRRVDGRAR